MSKYILKKDLPFAKAGDEVTLVNSLTGFVVEAKGYRCGVNTNVFDDWIEEVKDPEKPKEIFVSMTKKTDGYRIGLIVEDESEIPRFADDKKKFIAFIEKREYKYKDYDDYIGGNDKVMLDFVRDAFNAARELK